MIRPIDSRKTRKKRKFGRIFSALLIPSIIIFILGYFFVYQPVMRIKAKGQVLVASAKEMKATLAQNDIDLLKKKVEALSGQYVDFEKEAKSVYWAGFIPYVADFKNGVEAGRYMVHVGEQSVEAIYPYADLIGFKKGQTSFVERSAEDRLQTAVATLDKVLTKIDAISSDIEQAEKRIKAIDASRYPEKVGNTVIRSRLINAKEQFEGLASLFVDAKPLVKSLPAILGKDKEQTYLVLFQNDKEQRATGGFLTAYAIFRIKEGKMNISQSENIYDLDSTITHPKAPEKILEYHIDVPQFYIRDSNLSPDFVESIKLFESLYAKSPKKVDYDGIIAIDTQILVDMLKIFGDTEAGGVRFTANIDERCDCPQVIYELSYIAGRRTGYIREDRKAILGDLMYALFYKAIGFSPSKYWGTLAQTMFKNLDEKHILLYFENPDIQKSVEKLNYAGRIRQFGGDYLHINNVNFAGAKSNQFVSESITSKTNFDNGKITREITIDFKNPYKPSNCSLNVENALCLNATLRNWMRLYVPKGTTLTDFKGTLRKAKVYEELGKTVIEGYLEIHPQSTAKAVITYTLPDSIKEDNYSLLMQKQSGELGQKLIVEIDGKEKYNNGFEKDVQVSN